MITSGCVLVMLFLLGGCGEQKSAEQVGSFREGVSLTDESLDSTATLTVPTLSNDNNKDGLVSKEEQADSNDISANEPTLPTSQVSKEYESTQPTSTSTTVPTPTTSITSPTALPSSKPTHQVLSQQQEQQSTSTQAVTSKQSSNNIEPKPTTTTTIELIKPTADPAKEIKKSKYQSISWNGFFDTVEQNTPSDEFWDLSEANATVQIKGFMGEILSLDKNWFLLIPEPGAECPFDNGDETYWNKIMIVYVEDGTKLRYTSKALQITGRLDVGVKVDESGYKTMFRLYDASFEEIKE